MKNTYKTLAFLLFLSLLFVQCKTEPQRNRDIPYNDLQTVLTNLTPLPQSFTIDPKEDNQLKGKRGTVVFVPANLFRFEDGSVPTGEVQVELKESYSLTEIIGAGLHTMSGNRMLETAGMVYVNATADGKPLKVQDGKAFVVSFPKNQQTEEMDLFYSLALKDSVETWVPDYLLFQAEMQTNAGGDTLKSGVDTGFVGFYDKYENSDVRSVYPFELTDDLYDVGFDLIHYWTGFIDLPPTGYDKSLWSYFREANSVDSSIVSKFCDNEWYVYIDFKIGKNGKMHSFRPNKYGLFSEQMTKEAYAAGVKVLESTPPYNMNSRNASKVDFNQYYTIGFNCAHVLNLDRFKLKFRNQYIEFQEAAQRMQAKEELDYYTFSVTKFGWINCDRFLDMDASELTNFAVNTASPNTATVRLIFKDMNSIMEGSYQDGKIIFPNVPKGKPVKLVGISYADSKPMMATAETVIGEKGFELTGYQPFTLDEMEAALNK